MVIYVHVNIEVHVRVAYRIINIEVCVLIWCIYLLVERFFAKIYGEHIFLELICHNNLFKQLI